MNSLLRHVSPTLQWLNWGMWKSTYKNINMKNKQHEHPIVTKILGPLLTLTAFWSLCRSHSQCGGIFRAGFTGNDNSSITVVSPWTNRAGATGNNLTSWAEYYGWQTNIGTCTRNATTHRKIQIYSLRVLGNTLHVSLNVAMYIMLSSNLCLSQITKQPSLGWKYGQGMKWQENTQRLLQVRQILILVWPVYQQMELTVALMLKYGPFLESGFPSWTGQTLCLPFFRLVGP